MRWQLYRRSALVPDSGRIDRLQRAWPLCGDPGWDYANGTDDRDGMACRISCGYRWTADDPGWRAQVLPDQAA